MWEEVSYDEFYDFLEGKRYMKDHAWENAQWYVEDETNEKLGLCIFDTETKDDIFKLNKFRTIHNGMKTVSPSVFKKFLKNKNFIIERTLEGGDWYMHEKTGESLAHHIYNPFKHTSQYQILAITKYK